MTVPCPALLALALTLPAAAQESPTQGVDAHGFQVAALDGDPRDPMAVHRPGRLQQGAWFVSGLMEYAHAPLVWVQEGADGQRVRTPALDHLVALNLSLGVAVHERVRVDLALPLFLGSVDVDRAYQGVHFGDLRFTALGLLIPPDRDDQGLGLGLSAHLDIPTGAAAVQLGQRTIAGGGRVSGTYGWPRWSVGGELGFQLNPKIELGNLTNPDQLLLGATVGYLILPSTAAHLELRVLPAVRAGSVAGAQSPAELMASVRHRFASGAHLNGGVGTALSPGVGAPRLRLVVGGGFGRRLSPLPGDADNDGLHDQIDACPDQPEDLDQVEDQDGCPDLSAVLSLDVVHDGARMPGVPVRLTSPQLPEVEVLTRSEPVEVEVPEGSAWLGEARASCLLGRREVLAVDGLVPFQLELRARYDAPVHVEVRTTGGKLIPGSTLTWRSTVAACVPAEPMQNPTGLLDLEIGAGDHQLLVEAPGFGIRQATVRATPGLEQRVDIVLEPTRLRVESDEIVILERVYFDTDRATIRPASFPLLDELAALLVARPELGALEIAGHTDNTGSASHNQTLSEQRALAVRDHLAAKGVSPDRLTANGYGESRPLASNDTEAGQDKNRRVEFKRLDAADLP
jgi:outer membrane protein OmpA-like peptidoglycan-associated protein